MSDDIKEIMRGGSREKNQLSPEIAAKFEEIKVEVLDSIEQLKDQYNNNNIPFTALQNKTQFEYKLISDAILSLIIEKKLLGFINDGGTEAHDDDILILRDKRLIDDLEPDYETGYAE